jgi:hypothetical protein
MIETIPNEVLATLFGWYSIIVAVYWLLSKAEPSVFKRHWYFVLAIFLAMPLNYGVLLFVAFVIRLLYCRFWRQATKATPAVNVSAIIERVKAEMP